jgi:hypothetical protein
VAVVSQCGAIALQVNRRNGGAAFRQGAHWNRLDAPPPGSIHSASPSRRVRVRRFGIALARKICGALVVVWDRTIDHATSSIPQGRPRPIPTGNAGCSRSCQRRPRTNRNQGAAALFGRISCRAPIPLTDRIARRATRSRERRRRHEMTAGCDALVTHWVVRDRNRRQVVRAKRGRRRGSASEAR